MTNRNSCFSRPQRNAPSKSQALDVPAPLKLLRWCVYASRTPDDLRMMALSLTIRACKNLQVVMS